MEGDDERGEAAHAALARGMARHLTDVRERMRRGARRVGWKVAFNAPAVQRHFGLTAPCAAALDGTKLHHNGTDYPRPAGADLRLEAEIAIQVGGTVPASVGVAEAASQVVAIAPAIELVDYARPRDDLEVMASHGFFHEGTILGRALDVGALAELPPDRPRVRVNGAVVAEPAAELALPPLGVLLLTVARFLAAYGPEHLQQGDWVLGGSLTPSAAVVPGDRCEADFGPLGTVEVTVR